MAKTSPTLVFQPTATVNSLEHPPTPSTSTGLITESFSQSGFQINLEEKKNKEKLKITVHSKSWKFPGDSSEVESSSAVRWVLSQGCDVVPTSLAPTAGAFQSLIFVHKFLVTLLWTADTNKSGSLFHFYTLNCLILLPMNVITDKSAQKVMAIALLHSGRRNERWDRFSPIFLFNDHEKKPLKLVEWILALLSWLRS